MIFFLFILIENSGKTHLYYSGFQLGNKYEVLENIPEPIWEFLLYLDLKPLPEDYYSFDYGLSLSGGGSQQIFINWNERSYYFSLKELSNLILRTIQNGKLNFLNYNVFY